MQLIPYDILNKNTNDPEEKAWDKSQEDNMVGDSLLLLYNCEFVTKHHRKSTIKAELSNLLLQIKRQQLRLRISH